MLLLSQAASLEAVGVTVLQRVWSLCLAVSYEHGGIPFVCSAFDFEYTESMHDCEYD